MNTHQRLIVAGLVAFSLGACKTAPKKEAELDANGQKIEYVYYTPTGSNFPVKVRKDQIPNTTSEQSRADQEAMNKAVERGRKTGALN